jgi:hypothetical protein
MQDAGLQTMCSSLITVSHGLLHVCMLKVQMPSLARFAPLGVAGEWCPG